jgi:uncharacterized protein (UPF0128 family)
MLWEECAGGGFMDLVSLDCDLRRDWVNGFWRTLRYYRRTAQGQHRYRWNKVLHSLQTFEIDYDKPAAMH